jgi:hypothetical protein
MVADSAGGFCSDSGGIDLFHSRSGAALAVYVFRQVTGRDALASSIAFSRVRHPFGALG